MFSLKKLICIVFVILATQQPILTTKIYNDYEKSLDDIAPIITVIFHSQFVKIVQG